MIKDDELFYMLIQLKENDVEDMMSRLGGEKKQSLIYALNKVGRHRSDNQSEKPFNSNYNE